MVTLGSLYSTVGNLILRLLNNKDIRLMLGFYSCVVVNM